MYPYRHITPVTFVDPSGLRLFAKGDENDAQELLTYVRGITGDSQYDLDGNTIIYKGEFSSDNEYQEGSEIGRALIRALHETNLNIGVSFVDRENESQNNSSGDAGRITFNRKEGYEQAPTKDMLAEFVHEATHAFVKTFRLDDKLVVNFKEGLSDHDKNAYQAYVDKKYNEATALLVENRFRNEIGAGQRADGKQIGANQFGTFPHDFNRAIIPEEGFSRPSDPSLKGNVNAFILKSFGPNLDQYILSNYGY